MNGFLQTHFQVENVSLYKVTVHIDLRNLLFKEVNMLDSQRYPFTSLLDIHHFCSDKDEKAVSLQILKLIRFAWIT